MNVRDYVYAFIGTGRFGKKYKLLRDVLIECLDPANNELLILVITVNQQDNRYVIGRFMDTYGGIIPIQFRRTRNEVVIGRQNVIRFISGTDSVERIIGANADGFYM